MKKILALILALCLLACVLPMVAMAEAPGEITVKLRNVTAANDITIKLKPGETAYATSDENKAVVKWEGTEAPADKFIKLEYVSGEKAVIKATLKNFVVDISSEDKTLTRHAIEFTEADYAVEMELIGNNVINHHHSSAIYYKNAGGLTITGAGNLSMSFGNADNFAVVAGAIWGYGGDLVLKSNFNVFIDSEKNTLHHAFLASKGNVVIDGAKITTQLDGGQVVFMGIAGTQVRSRNDIDPATDRFITIKNSEITSSGTLSAFRSTTAATISNSTLKLSKTGSASGDSSALLVPVPTFEGEHTVRGGVVSKPQNAKPFDAKKNSSYTYIEVLPYVVETETTAPTTATNPVESDASVPEATTPDTIPPVVTTPNASEPAADNTPNATTPAATTPATTAPDAKDPTDAAEAKPISTLKVIMIIMICVAVGAGATVGVIYFVTNKKQKA